MSEWRMRHSKFSKKNSYRKNRSYHLFKFYYLFGIEPPPPPKFDIIFGHRLKCRYSSLLPSSGITPVWVSPSFLLVAVDDDADDNNEHFASTSSPLSASCCCCWCQWGCCCCCCFAETVAAVVAAVAAVGGGGKAWTIGKPKRRFVRQQIVVGTALPLHFERRRLLLLLLHEIGHFFGVQLNIRHFDVLLRHRQWVHVS